MIKREVAVNPQLPADYVEQTVTEICLAAGLRVTLKSTLAAYPGSVHWHLKQGSARGTLEITWWPAPRQLWLAVQTGRTGPWIEAMLAGLPGEIESTLAA